MIACTSTALLAAMSLFGLWAKITEAKHVYDWLRAKLGPGASRISFVTLLIFDLLIATCALFAPDGAHTTIITLVVGLAVAGYHLRAKERSCPCFGTIRRLAEHLR